MTDEAVYCNIDQAIEFPYHVTLLAMFCILDMSNKGKTHCICREVSEKVWRIIFCRNSSGCNMAIAKYEWSTNNKLA